MQLGDNNRNYTVKLACLEVDPVDEESAKSWLRSELPRRKRVNLRPESSHDGVLLARVIPLESDIEMMIARQAVFGRQCQRALNDTAQRLFNPNVVTEHF